LAYPAASARDYYYRLVFTSPSCTSLHQQISETDKHTWRGGTGSRNRFGKPEAMKKVWFRTVAISCWVRSVQCQADSLTTLNSNVSFLESGLTTLAVLSAGITVLARSDLAYESMLRDWQYTVIDTGTAQILGPDVLLVSNLESIGLSLFTTRVYQGAGMECAVVKWKLAGPEVDPDNINCRCILVTCPDSCVELLQKEWGDQVVLCIENPSKAILLSSHCWIQDVHWNFAKPTRERYVFCPHQTASIA
jgi:hypothetical protein